MHFLTETAKAKVNLTLDIYGRRADGYHELSSLVVFADFGDQLTYRPGAPCGLDVEGEFSHLLGDENLILDVVAAVKHSLPDLITGRFVLKKNLPISSGIGGGSADAAACIRLLEKAHPRLLSRNALQDIATNLGADVPVCLLQQAAVMSGIGENISVLREFKPVNAVLVNPMITLSTREVFDDLAAEIFDPQAHGYRNEQRDYNDIIKFGFKSLRELRAFMTMHPNSLEGIAVRHVPEIKKIKKLIADDKDCMIAAMSGSGPTLFGLYNTEHNSLNAVERLSQINKNWWVKAVKLY